MPFTVITLKKVPPSLRGDLTRWMQEIATGVYVGNYNSRVREYLWKRVTDTVGNGEATLCYSCRNEIGYSFCTCNTERYVVDYDGIPLVLIPTKESSDGPAEKKTIYGFSDASKFYHASRKVGPKAVQESKARTEDNKSADLFNTAEKQPAMDLVFLDIETTGLNIDNDQIIEIGAVKVSGEKETIFHRLIYTDFQIPDLVCSMTGITNETLRNGTVLDNSIMDLSGFLQGAVLIGYNLSFDLKFLNRDFEKFFFEPIHNKTIDLMNEAKKRNSFQDNYRFETTLKEYGINQKVPHRALEDAKLMYQLYKQMGLS